MQKHTLEQLIGLQEAALEQAAQAKQALAQIQNELNNRYGEAINVLLKKKEEPFGSTKLLDGDYIINADQTEKVAWDNSMLKTMALELGDKADEYLEVEYSMKESRFKALPESQREWFARARTVAPGSLKIVLERKGE